jgi:ABC-type Mn2+/Zn2+ transport system permease subunit
MHGLDQGILNRGIIFTDLAIAQMAALGSAISLGYFHGEYLYVFTLAFALFAGLIIAYATTLKVQLEAFIGLIYVLGASGILMVLSRTVLRGWSISNRSLLMISYSRPKITLYMPHSLYFDHCPYCVENLS